MFSENFKKAANAELAEIAEEFLFDAGHADAATDEREITSKEETH